MNWQAVDQDEDFSVDKPLYGNETQPPTGEVDEPSDQIDESGGRIENNQRERKKNSKISGQ